MIVDGFNYYKAFVESTDSYDQFLGCLIVGTKINFIIFLLMEVSRTGFV